MIRTFVLEMKHQGLEQVGVRGGVYPAPRVPRGLAECAGGQGAVGQRVEDGLGQGVQALWERRIPDVALFQVDHLADHPHAFADAVKQAEEGVPVVTLLAAGNDLPGSVDVGRYFLPLLYEVCASTSVDGRHIRYLVAKGLDLVLFFANVDERAEHTDQFAVFIQHRTAAVLEDPTFATQADDNHHHVGNAVFYRSVVGLACVVQVFGIDHADITLPGIDHRFQGQPEVVEKSLIGCQYSRVRRSEAYRKGNLVEQGIEVQFCA
ncbi:hypothetical protein D3C76_1119720 [compost metagenome]